MVEVAFCMLALMAGGVSLELFCDEANSSGSAGRGTPPAAVEEFNPGNPS